MHQKVTFLHAADMHLGAPFRGLRKLSAEWADRLVDASAHAFDRLVDTALVRQVDFVVMAGDIFDLAKPSYADFMRFFEGVKRLGEQGIPVYLCTGNHDPFTSWYENFAHMPANVHVFAADKPSFMLHRRDGQPLALLAGRGYFNQTVSKDQDLAEGITRQQAEIACGAQAPFAIGVLHTGLHLDTEKAPTNPRALLASGMDYWALGHIHTPWVDNDENPRLVFPGCIQGRDIKETGPRGCMVVTLEEGARNRAEFVSLASVVWQLMDVDVTGAATLSDCYDAIVRELFVLNGKAQCDEMVERIRLVGRTRVHGLLGDPAVVEDLRSDLNTRYPTFFCDALIDATEPEIDRVALESEGLFLATLLDQARQQAQHGLGLVIL